MLTYPTSAIWGARMEAPPYDVLFVSPVHLANPEQQPANIFLHRLANQFTMMTL